MYLWISTQYLRQHRWMYCFLCVHPASSPDDSLRSEHLVLLHCLPNPSRSWGSNLETEKQNVAPNIFRSLSAYNQLSFGFYLFSALFKSRTMGHSLQSSLEVLFFVCKEKQSLSESDVMTDARMDYLQTTLAKLNGGLQYPKTIQILHSLNKTDNALTTRVCFQFWSQYRSQCWLPYLSQRWFRVCCSPRAPRWCRTGRVGSLPVGTPPVPRWFLESPEAPHRSCRSPVPL